MSSATTPPAPTQEDDNVFEEVADKLGDLAFDFVAESNPKLERMGLRYFERRADKAGQPPPDDGAIHILEPHELEAMRRAEWAFIGWAALIGGLAGLASGLAEFFGQPLAGSWTYHLLVHGVTIVATIAEVYALYFVGLRGVHDMAHAAGLSLGGGQDEATPAAKRAVVLALARVAMELPNPPRNAFGVDPYRELPKWRLVLAGILYKLKITATTFVLRLLMTRMATRFGLHAWLAFVSAPVTAVWDGLVARGVVREARIRAMGPSAAAALLRDIRRTHPNLSQRCLHTMARAIAASIVRSADPHPNLLSMLRALDLKQLGQVESIDDTERFLDEIAALEADERDAVVEVLTLSAVIDGHISRREMELIEQVAKRCEFVIERRSLKALQRDFKAGRAMTRERIDRAVHPA